MSGAIVPALPAAPAAAEVGPLVCEHTIEVRPDAAAELDAWYATQLEALASRRGLLGAEVLAGEQPEGWQSRTALLRFAQPAELDAFLAADEPQMRQQALERFGDRVRLGVRALRPRGRVESAPAVPVRRCDNCGAPLAGEYCSSCGQRVEPHIHSLWGFMTEAAEAVTHADSRLWQTLRPLLCKPGVLTREFLAGRRARYLPPFRLYIVISLLFFLLVPSLQDGEPAITVGADGADGVASLTASPDAGLSAAAVSGTPDERIEEAIRELEAALATETSAARRLLLEQALRAARARQAQASAASGAADGAAAGSPDEPDETPEQRAERLCGDVSFELPGGRWIEPRLQAGCRKAVRDGGRQLGKDFLHNVPRAMFIFLPLLGGVMKLLYWRPRRYYVEHLLFLVHNHAFTFLALGLYVALAALVPQRLATPLSLALLAYLLWYFYASLRTAYGQSRGRTLAKFVVLGFTYFVLGVFMLVLTVLFSVMTL